MKDIKYSKPGLICMYSVSHGYCSFGTGPASPPNCFTGSYAQTDCSTGPNVGNPEGSCTNGSGAN